jgi:hypothetical protein
MNTQLVDSFAERFGTKIVQMVETLPPAERELVKQKLSILPDLELPDRKTELTLEAGALAAHRPLQMKETLKRRLIG